MNRQFLVGVALAGVGCAAMTSMARAEGSKSFGEDAFGVNRVVRSTSNHTSASGHVNIEFTMPIDKDAAGHYVYTPNVNPYNNKPSPYLGGVFVSGLNGRLAVRNDPRNIRRLNDVEQIDAGIQFEPGTINNFQVGWAPAVSIGDTYLPIHKGIARLEVRIGSWDQDTSKLLGHGLLDLDVSYSASPTDGISLTLGGVGTIYWHQRLSAADTGVEPDATHPVGPYQPDLRMVSSNQRRANVKRVAAMTRSKQNRAHSELDGSSLSCVWSGCTLNGGAWVVDQNVTGYDAPADGNSKAKDKRLNGRPVFIGGNPTLSSQNIVQFEVNGAENATYRHDIVNATRYNTEKVNINLGMVASPILPSEVELQP